MFAAYYAVKAFETFLVAGLGSGSTTNVVPISLRFELKTTFPTSEGKKSPVAVVGYVFMANKLALLIRRPKIIEINFS